MKNIYKFYCKLGENKEYDFLKLKDKMIISEFMHNNFKLYRTLEPVKIERGVRINWKTKEVFNMPIIIYKQKAKCINLETRKIEIIKIGKQ